MARLKEEVNQADFILTGEGRFDQTSCVAKAHRDLSMRVGQKNAALVCGSIDSQIREKSVKISVVDFLRLPKKKDLEKPSAWTELFSETLGKIIREIYQEK